MEGSNCDQVADILGQSFLGKKLLRMATNCGYYTVIIPYQTLTSTPPSLLVLKLQDLRNSHGLNLFLVLLHPDSGIIIHPHIFSNFPCFQKLPLATCDELRQAAVQVVDALGSPDSLVDYFRSSHTDCNPVISLCQIHTEQLNTIELSSTTGAKWAVVGGLDILSTVFDSVNDLPQSIDEKCIFFFGMLNTRSGINFTLSDSLKLLCSIFQKSEKFPKYETDEVLKKMKETVEALEGSPKDSASGAHVEPSMTLHKLYNFLCHIGAKVEPSMKLTTIGLTAKLQDSFSDHSIIDFVNKAICTGIYVFMLSSFVINRRRHGLPSASNSNAESAKERKFENISNVLAAGALFGIAVVIFSRGFLELPLRFAVTGVLSCFGMLISAALYGYF